MPVSSRVLMSCSPTMAGMLSDRAMMAVCDVRLPASVAKPRTNSRLSSAVSDGRQVLREQDVRIMNVREVDRGLPARFIITRRVTSWMSSARSRRYGSSICSSNWA